MIIAEHDDPAPRMAQAMRVAFAKHGIETEGVSAEIFVAAARAALGVAKPPLLPGDFIVIEPK